MNLRLLSYLLLLALIGHVMPSHAEDEMIKIKMGGSYTGLRDSKKQDAEIAFSESVGKLVKELNIDLSVSIYESTEDMLKAFDRGEINGIFGSPLEFLAREDQMGNDMMGVRFMHAPMKQKLLLLVRKDDNIQSILDLKNKRLTLSTTQDIETMYLNVLLLENHQMEIPNFFAEQLSTKNSSTAIMDVFFGKSDATIVRESEFATAIELNPQLNQKLTVLMRSPPYISLVGGGKVNLKPDTIKKTMESIQKLYATPQGRNSLNQIQAQSIELVTKSDLKDIRDLVNEYHTLQSAMRDAKKSLKTTSPIVSKSEPSTIKKKKR